LTLFRNKYHIESTRLPGYDYSQPGAYFVTMVTKDRKCVFGRIVNGIMRLNEIGAIIKYEWMKTGLIRRNIIIDEFIVMPNHFHGIIVITDSVKTTRRVVSTEKTTDSPIVSTEQMTNSEIVLKEKTDKRPNGPKSGSIGAIIGQFKSKSTKRIIEISNDPGITIWQPRFYDHIIRNEESLNRIRQYIIDNPMRWEIVDENPIK
jgi:REP element-mobilizing transposase RayT